MARAKAKPKVNPEAGMLAAFESAKVEAEPVAAPADVAPEPVAPVAPAPVVETAEPATSEENIRRSVGRPKREEKTRLVGAQLSSKYTSNLKYLSAKTGKSNRELLELALDRLFDAEDANHFKE